MGQNIVSMTTSDYPLPLLETERALLDLLIQCLYTQPLAGRKAIEIRAPVLLMNAPLTCDRLLFCLRLDATILMQRQSHLK